MASIKQMETKDGKRFFQISVSRGYGKAPYKTRWYWPDGWSRRTAEREAAKQAAERGGKEAKLLLQRNKWVIAHPEREPLIKQGAWPGVLGENRELKY